jgi:hypothetical protein
LHRTKWSNGKKKERMETTLLKKIIQYRIQREIKKMGTQFLTTTKQ